jgi:hypothetical protein
MEKLFFFFLLLTYQQFRERISGNTITAVSVKCGVLFPIEVLEFSLLSSSVAHLPFRDKDAGIWNCPLISS